MKAPFASSMPLAATKRLSGAVAAHPPCPQERILLDAWLSPARSQQQLHDIQEHPHRNISRQIVTFYLLYLIQDNQCLAWYNSLPRYGSYCHNDSLDVVILHEECFSHRLFITIDISYIGIFCLTKLLQYVGFLHFFTRTSKYFQHFFTRSFHQFQHFSTRTLEFLLQESRQMTSIIERYII